MEFSGIKIIPIESLGISQIYLNEDKIKNIESWFDPQKMDSFLPLPVHDFGNDKYTLTDGHTRAYVAYKNDITFLPIIYDTDNIVSDYPGHMMYKIDIDWCNRFGLKNIRDLRNRILSNNMYEKLWFERCDRSYHLITQTTDEERNYLQSLFPELYLYGASENRQIFYYEDQYGVLYVFEKGRLACETITQDNK